MAQQIRDVLNRRTDLSTFVVHLTKDTGERTARQALESIIDERQLHARSPMGFAAEMDDPDDPNLQSQRVVCFSETPLEHIYSLVADIENRQVRLAPYGVAFTKVVARRRGVNPVWYVDQSWARTWHIAKAIDELVDDAKGTPNFHEQPIAHLAPFVESMFTHPESRKEFWWEREWRHAGDMHIPFGQVIWLCPENEIDELRDHQDDPLHKREPVIDPRWGLEQIIAHLAGFKQGDVTPFEPH
jgi:hypothetical protein